MRALKRLTSTAVAAVAVAAALSACGGGVSKPSFLAKADGACASGNGTLAGLTKPTNQPELATAAGTIASARRPTTCGARWTPPP